MKQIGRYNVDFAGKVWDGNRICELTIISEFNSSEKEVDRKTFYVIGDIPEIETEAEVARIMKLPQNSIIRLKRILKVEVVV